MKNRWHIVFVLGAVAFLVSCGSSSSSDDTPSIASIEDLPRATSPVVSAVSGSISAKDAIVTKTPATTGVVLKNFAADTFGAGDSLDMCEATNQAKMVISEAAMADMILCYVQNIVAGDPDLEVIYDGEYHVLGLEIGEDGGAPDHLKMKVTKSGGAITEFEMFMCQDGSQTEYVKQTISGTTMGMVAKGLHTGGGWNGAHQVVVSGTLNSSGQFISKTIELDQYGAPAAALENTNWSEATVTQYSNGMTFNGYNAGSWGGSDYGNRVYSSFQLIDGNASASNENYDIGILAVGNGAANGFFESDWGINDFIAGWNGDTKLRDDTVTVGTTSTTWVSVVNEVPRTVDVQPTIVFSADQAYACDGAEELDIVADQAALDAACSRFSLGHGWVDCCTATGQCGPAE